ncbi:unnamed protein product [Allacma fusca]|uniref:Uncharacterized protein n=1 Tax=Allacma fusca TaxID=39272 RepID=A0A8J2L1N3_9HEXA|nr:unnamed protein product [Allacma fusca]
MPGCNSLPNRTSQSIENLYENNVTRRLKRYVDVNYSYRKLFLIVVGVFALIWILGFRLFPSEAPSVQEPAADCLTRKLYRFADESANYDTNIIHNPPLPEEKNYLPYVGNGYLGVGLYEEALISIKPQNGRTLSAALPFRPFVRVSVMDEEFRREAVISQYGRGTVHRQACIEFGHGDSLETLVRYYAHRTYPTVLEQDVTIKNPGPTEAIVEFEQLGWTGDPPFTTGDVKKIQQGDEELSYLLGSGVIEINKKLIGVAIVYKKVPNALTVKAKSSKSIRFITVVNYAYLSNRKEFETVQVNLMNKSEQELKRALSHSMQKFQDRHETAWQDLWSTGFYISPSRAINALNGDKINATMYYVLSQVRDPLHEVDVLPTQVTETKAVLSYSEGCYGGHHTLQAPSLWSNLETQSDVLSVTNLWLLTLEKLGCHNLLRAGAPGVMQGMVLSFGALKFSNQHLEFNTEPKDLHRDYLFRRVWYGNATHVNISVKVEADNKAVLFVALDRSDKDYYACDAGCLDSPIELSTEKKRFPVKVTDPATAVLYITSDRRHIEELRLSIHVKEVIEAPAHENHVISMHKHGSGYGAMSTMFWVSISLLIILFHLFLFHLVYTEYFGSQDKFRTRKVSDF